MTLARAIHIGAHQGTKLVTMTHLWICDGGQVFGYGFGTEYATDPTLTARQQTPSHIVMPLTEFIRRCPSAIMRGKDLSGRTESQNASFRIWIFGTTTLGEIVQTPGQIAAGIVVIKQLEMADSGALIQGGDSSTVIAGRTDGQDAGQ